jgi:hypothetical protein
MLLHSLTLELWCLSLDSRYSIFILDYDIYVCIWAAKDLEEKLFTKGKSLFTNKY